MTEKTSPTSPMPGFEPYAYFWMSDDGQSIQYWTRDLAQAARQETRLGRPPMQLFASAAPVAQEPVRTDAEIVLQTEELARLLMSEIYSREAPEDLLFRNADDPRGKRCWQLACKAQEINEDDAFAEGIERLENYSWGAEAARPLGTYLGLDRWSGTEGHWTDTVSAYRALWERINGAGSWAANPWVWVVEFRREHGQG